MKRVAVYSLRHHQFLDVFNGDVKLVLPDDAILIDIDINHAVDNISLLYSSKTYAEVDPAIRPPILEALFTSTRNR